jgi:Rps23 Pro-64 3,4-dihydroxylase Tpa1-like proline 4-hydroxylase
MIEYRDESDGVISVSLFDVAQCRKIVDRVSKLEDWEPAQVRETDAAGHSESLLHPEVRSTSIFVSAQAEDVYRSFDFAMDEILKPLVKQVWKIDLTEHSGTQILKYGPADHYVPHQDSGPGLESRYLSVVCYLNDNFLGGETSFPGCDYTAKPQTGRAIIFPSHYLHGSVPVKSGEKFVIVSWLRGPVAIKWI